MQRHSFAIPTKYVLPISSACPVSVDTIPAQGSLLIPLPSEISHHRLELAYCGIALACARVAPSRGSDRLHVIVEGQVDWQLWCSLITLGRRMWMIKTSLQSDVLERDTTAMSQTTSLGSPLAPGMREARRNRGDVGITSQLHAPVERVGKLPVRLTR